jgi:hypothetical protein
MKKSKKTNVIRNGNSGIIHIPDANSYAFQIGASTSASWVDQLSSSATTSTTTGWESDPQIIQGKKIVPYGTNNNLPLEIRNVMDENNLAPGILEREIGLLWGNGPQLYKDIWENGDYRKEFIHDPEIWTFLKDFDHIRYLLTVIAEYKYLKAHFTKFFLNKGARIGRTAKITKLECVPAVDARLGWVNTRRLEDVKNIYTGDFENNCSDGITTFPIFDANNPFKNRVSMYYYNAYSFARNFYPTPAYYGTLNWIKRSSDIPQIIKYLTDNSLNIGYMVYSPQAYWDKKLDMLKEQYADKDDLFINSQLDTLKDTVFGKLSEVMSGKKNVGKFFESVTFHDDEGHECKWEVKPIDHKTKDFIEAQIEISKKADAATTSGIGLHPSLSNIMVDGKLSSGSEMLYALKLYLSSDIAIPENIIMQGINAAIQANFPSKNLKLGFYHKIVLREENVNPEKRTSNVI